MSIFLFVLGIVIGFFVKLAFDQYHLWQNQQKKTYTDMEQILINWKAIEKIKEMEKPINVK